MKKLEITDVKKTACGNEAYINGKFAFDYYNEERRGEAYKGFELSGHKAMIILWDMDGTWFNEDGEEIDGYLYFKPDAESGKLKVTGVRKVADDASEVYINDNWAFDYYDTETLANGYEGAEVSGHEAMIYLGGLHGTWFTEDGEEIDGYLYFKPAGE